MFRFRVFRSGEFKFGVFRFSVFRLSADFEILKRNPASVLCRGFDPNRQKKRIEQRAQRKEIKNLLQAAGVSVNKYIIHAARPDFTHFNQAFTREDRLLERDPERARARDLKIFSAPGSLAGTEFEDGREANKVYSGECSCVRACVQGVKTYHLPIVRLVLILRREGSGRFILWQSYGCVCMCARLHWCAYACTCQRVYSCVMRGKGWGTILERRRETEKSVIECVRVTESVYLCMCKRI